MIENVCCQCLNLLTDLMLFKTYIDTMTYYYDTVCLIHTRYHVKLKVREGQDSHTTYPPIQVNVWTDQGLVQDGAVGGDGVLSFLHHGHLPAVVRTVCQAVDRAALGAGTD